MNLTEYGCIDILLNQDVENIQNAHLEEPQVDSDDWDLGPACGLAPEECEACQ